MCDRTTNTKKLCTGIPLGCALEISTTDPKTWRPFKELHQYVMTYQCHELIRDNQQDPAPVTSRNLDDDSLHHMFCFISKIGHETASHTQTQKRSSTQVSSTLSMPEACSSVVRSWSPNAEPIHTGRHYSTLYHCIDYWLTKNPVLGMDVSISTLCTK